MNVGRPDGAAIAAVPYAAAVKVGLQFKRRFWEEDEQIYGGITYTDLPIRHIGYPSTGYHRGGKGVLLGAYHLRRPNAFEFTAMSPAERVAGAVEYGAASIRNIATSSRTASPSPGIARPFTLGCSGMWTRRRARARTTTILRRSTGASCWRASTPPICPPGRKARSSRRSMRSSGCTSG